MPSSMHPAGCSDTTIEAEHSAKATAPVTLDSCTGDAAATVSPRQLGCYTSSQHESSIGLDTRAPARINAQPANATVAAAAPSTEASAAVDKDRGEAGNLPCCICLGILEAIDGPVEHLSEPLMAAVRKADPSAGIWRPCTLASTQGLVDMFRWHYFLGTTNLL